MNAPLLPAADHALFKLVEDDPLAITDELIRAYQTASGKTLFPAQIERLLIDLMAYRETLVRTLINDVARQNLVAFARAPMLDYLGELVGVTRLPAQPARTTLRFVRSSAAAQPTLIPTGTLLQAAPGLAFATTQAVSIAAGLAGLSVDVPALCVLAGPVGNGFLPVQVTTALSALPDAVTGHNITLSAGGADPESDERLRERIRLAPEMFSTAGPRLAYRFAAMSASPLVLDVAVASPQPGVVRLYPLTSAGLPTPEMKALVLAAASAEDVRPLCDGVEVADPLALPFAVSAELTLYRDADAADTLRRAQAALQAACSKIAAALGRDVVRSQLIAALSVPGVYRVELDAPHADTVVPEHGWAHCTAQTLTLAGVVDG